MKLVIFGLTVSLPWGNGHATLWRCLIRSQAGVECPRSMRNGNSAQTAGAHR
jgi:hypothetical protein